MKTNILLLLAAMAAATAVSAQSLRVTQIDTGALLVQGQIDAYVSLTGPEGDLLKSVDPKAFSASERGADGSRSLEILDVRAEAARETGIDFLLLVDNSGSMYDPFQEGGTRIEYAQQALTAFLGSMAGSGDRVALGAFNTDLHPLARLGASTGEMKRSLVRIERPESESAYTELYAALERFLPELAPATGRKAVIVLSDHYNATAIWSVAPEAFDPRSVRIDRGKLLSEQELETAEEYRRYAITPDGVSPRALPGAGPRSVYLTTGNEHRQDGQITEDPDITTAMADKRLRKLEGVLTEMRPPIRMGPADAGLTFVCWGSSYGPVLEAMALLNESGTAANLVQFVDLWPFPVDKARKALADAKRLVCVEGNATAQFAALLYAQTDIRVDQTILKYDGRGFTPEYILDRVDARAIPGEGR